MPIPFVITRQDRPDRFTKDKDERYHTAFARYCGSTLNNPIMSQYYWNVWRNWMFYTGNQWIGPEDTTVFFEDESGEAKGRVRFVQNVIRPFVNQIVGEAMKMSLDFKVQSVGDRVINRREKELVRMKAVSALAETYPDVRNHLKKQLPIGSNMEETEEIFRNVWVDQYERTVNNLCTYIATRNKLSKKLLRRYAESIAVTGLGVLRNEGRFSDLVSNVVQSENFFFDAGCEEYDLSDAEYMGETQYALPTDLYERYDISMETKKQIEKYTRELPVAAPTIMPVPYSYSYLPGRIPKIYVEWRDLERQNYGYVKDPYGYEFLTRIHDNSYKSTDGQRIYRMSDLIEPRSDRAKTFMGGKKVKYIDAEQLRYCTFTPSEIYTGGEGYDIVYEYGIVPYQEVYALDPTIVEFSYRAVTWNYHDGLINGPVDDIIDPQRLVNRFNSIAESKANRSTEGVLIDTWAALGTNSNIEELQRKVERGETVMINSKGMGAPQAAHSYGTQGIQTAQAFKMLAQEYEGAAARMTGVVNIPNPKENKKVLMGQEAEEQSIHALFLSTVEDLMLQQYQCYSNKGRRVYYNSPRKLAIAVGDKGAQEIVVTKDLLLEDFRMEVKRTDDDKQSKAAADMKLDAWLAAGIISKDAYSDAYGRTTLDKLGEVVRDNMVREKAAQRAKAEEDQKQKQIQSMQFQANQELMELERKKQQNIALTEAEKDRVLELEKIHTRGELQILRDKVKAELKLKENEQHHRHEQEKK